MDQSDILYLVELLKDSINAQDWDTVEEAKTFLVEFLDEYQDDEEDED